MPTLHHLTNIILKQEVVNILNITNLVPQGIVNENQCTDKTAVLCFASARKCFVVDGVHWFSERIWRSSKFIRTLVETFPCIYWSVLSQIITQLLHGLT